MRRKDEKYAEMIRGKYTDGTEYAIRVLESCETLEQIEVCCIWVTNLFRQWMSHEEQIINDRHRGWKASRMALTMHGELVKLMGKFTMTHARKICELPKKEEN